MSTRIQKLSSAHDVELRKYYLQCLSNARSTERADRSKTSVAVERIYKACGMEAPVIIWCESPLQLALTPSLTKIAQVLTEEQRKEVAVQIPRKRGWLVGADSLATLWQEICKLIPASRTGILPDKPDAVKCDEIEEATEPEWTGEVPEGRYPGDFIDPCIINEISSELPRRLGAEFDAKIEGDARNQLDFLLRSRLRPDFESLKERVSLTVPGIKDSVHQMELMAEIVMDVWSSSQIGSKNSIRVAKELEKVVRRFVRAKSRELSSILEVEMRNVRLHSRMMTGFRLWGPWDSYFLSFYSFPRTFEEKFYSSALTRELDAWLTLMNSAIAYEFRENLCLICEHPKQMEIDDRGRLSSESGPAVTFHDGWQVYCWEGRNVSKELAEGKITTREIEKERNLEIRRLMINRYGEAKFLVDSRTRPVQKDQFGILYRKEMKNDEPIVMVKVINSTPEPDGESRAYFLRVPPTIRTAKEAVAWTFGMTSDDYEPDAET